MSAINHLKNFATSLAGNLFTSSKKNNSRRNGDSQENKMKDIPQKDKPAQDAAEKKQPAHAKPQLSDFIIF